MTVAHILQDKGRDIITIEADKSLADVSALLVEKKIGAVLIMEDQAIAGIVSERDVVRSLAAHGATALDLKAADVMTRQVITCTPADPIADVMAQMTRGRFRHVPVLENGVLVGLISIGDVVKHRIAETEQEAEALRDYILTGG